jgi:hypothetical protein
MPKTDLHRMRISKIPDNSVIFVIGKRASGKTTDILDIFSHKRHRFKYGICMCGSKATIKDYESVMPSTFIYYGFHGDVLMNLIEDQEKKVEEGTAQPVFVIIDDCNYLKKAITNDPAIIRLMMNGRHAKIFLVISLQYGTSMGPDLRQQVDFVFLKQEKNPENRLRLYKNFNVCFHSFAQFDACMRSCTLDRETMVLDNRSSTSDAVESNVFWLKSKYVEGGRTFRINPYGSWWKYHRRYFNTKHYLIPDEPTTVVRATRRATPKTTAKGAVRKVGHK